MTLDDDDEDDHEEDGAGGAVDKEIREENITIVESWSIQKDEVLMDDVNDEMEGIVDIIEGGHNILEDNEFLTAKEAVQQSIRLICLFVCLSQP